MTITTIRISDEYETGEIQTDISYELDENSQPDDPITPAALYGYAINWFIRTGKINEVLPEVIEELNSIALQEQEDDE